MEIVQTNKKNFKKNPRNKTKRSFTFKQEPSKIRALHEFFSATHTRHKLPQQTKSPRLIISKPHQNKIKIFLWPQKKKKKKKKNQTRSKRRERKKAQLRESESSAKAADALCFLPAAYSGAATQVRFEQRLSQSVSRERALSRLPRQVHRRLPRGSISQKPCRSSRRSTPRRPGCGRRRKKVRAGDFVGCAYGIMWNCEAKRGRCIP